MTLAITIGAPGAGKSTWADKNQQPLTLRLERDRFREALFGDRQSYHTNPLNKTDKSRVVTQAMGAAMIYWPYPSWIVSDTGLSFPLVKPFILHAKRVRVPVKLFIFDRPEKLLLERNAKRPKTHQVPDDVLADMITAYNNPEAWWKHCPYEKIYIK